MKLVDVARAADLTLARPAGGDVEIRAVTVDSRKVGPGVLFVACPGATPSSKDGHTFLQRALAQGAAAVVVAPERVGDVGGAVPVLVADDRRRAAALAVEAVLGYPSQRLAAVGVTGTNGKTTVSFLLARLLTELGDDAGVLGTLGAGRPDAVRSTGFTTPEAELLSAELVRLADEGLHAVVMEVSSIAIDTRRADGVAFRAAAFTNLSQDHLDFHGSMEAYGAAKARLFQTLLPGGATAVLPTVCDAFDVEKLSPPPGRPVITWAPIGASGGDVRAEDLELAPAATRFTLVIPEAGAGSTSARFPVETALLGEHNVENLLVVAGLAAGLGHSGEAIASRLGNIRGAPGRFERVGEGDPAVVVDYAHTPDALRRALSACRRQATGRVFVVVGAGGDRDPTKRAPMGRAVGEGADAVWLTNDNPRSESPARILGQLEEGVRQAGLGPWDGQRGYATCEDRETAIFTAVASAAPGDVVLLAGKGHETTMRIGDQEHLFDDREVARRAIAARGQSEGAQP